MATGFPALTGDVLSAAMYNGLVAFTLNAQTGATYTLASTDQFQVLVITSNASTKTVSVPTNATVAFPVGTAINFINTGAGTLTISATTPGTTTITSAGATSAAPTVAQVKGATCIKTATDAWSVLGGVS